MLVRLAVAIALGTGLGLATAKPVPRPFVPLQNVELQGLCLLDECGVPVAMEVPTAKQLLVLRQSRSPWLQAVAVLCDERGCPPGRQSYQQLKTALQSEHAPVRAMALLRLDIDSPGARDAAEALLQDASRLLPLAASVADHAYARLHPDIVPSGLDYSWASRPPRVPGWTAALSLYKGLAGLAELRLASTPVNPQWRQRLTQYDSQADPKSKRAILAGLWQLADLRALREALLHPALHVRLTAFDALLFRDPSPQPVETALQLLRQGGTQISGDCVPVLHTIAVTLLTALERSPFAQAPQEFLMRLPASNPAPEAGGFAPAALRTEVANYLAERPATAVRYKLVLRRWVDEGLAQLEGPPSARAALAAGGGFNGHDISRIAQVLASLNDAQDFPRLKRLAALGQFSAMGRRD